MKSLVFGITITMALVAGFTYLTNTSNTKTSFLGKSENSPDLLTAWLQWKNQNNKHFATSSEDQYRFAVFKENYNKILLVNASQGSYKLALNQFADMTHPEVKVQLNAKLDSSPRDEEFLDTSNLPKSVDWRKTGAVTSIKDQGACGSSWAWGVAGSIEGLAFNNKLDTSDVSVQQMVDCTTIATWGNNGCEGGYMTTTFKYLEIYGWMAEKDYKYTAELAKCKYDPKLVAGHNKSFKSVIPDYDVQLMAALVKGPVATAVDMNNGYMYKGGVFTGCEPGTAPNHGILAVGYGSENGQDFWILKNTWGANWGEEGFIRIARGSPNDCGVRKMASYPTY